MWVCAGFEWHISIFRRTKCICASVYAANVILCPERVRRASVYASTISPFECATIVWVVGCAVCRFPMNCANTNFSRSQSQSDCVGMETKLFIRDSECWVVSSVWCVVFVVLWLVRAWSKIAAIILSVFFIKVFFYLWSEWLIEPRNVSI